jgi:hypothetical protein
MDIDFLHGAVQISADHYADPFPPHLFAKFVKICAEYFFPLQPFLYPSESRFGVRNIDVHHAHLGIPSHEDPSLRVEVIGPIVSHDEFRVAIEACLDPEGFFAGQNGHAAVSLFVGTGDIGVVANSYRGSHAAILCGLSLGFLEAEEVRFQFA